MEAITGFLAGKAGWLALAGGAALFSWFGKKFIPGYVAKQTVKAYASIIGLGGKDPKRAELIQELVLAAVKLAEYEIPDKGTGLSKRKRVEEALRKILPDSKEDQIIELINIAVDAFDKELKALAKK